MAGNDLAGVECTRRLYVHLDNILHIILESLNSMTFIDGSDFSYNIVLKI